MTGPGSVTYEVTATLADAETAGRFPGWMERHHIPAVLATGCFESRIRARPLTSGFGGAEGIRTPDLLIANETRYQLRHSPMRLTARRQDTRAAGG